MGERNVVRTGGNRPRTPLDRFNRKRELTRYYVEGANAARRGEPKTTNPYVTETPAHEDWCDGYRDYQDFSRSDA